MSNLFSESIPDELLPFKGLLSERFYEVRKQVLSFVQEVVIPNKAKYASEKQKLVEKTGDELRTPQPAILKEMQRQAKERGIWNLFLPEVCNLSVLEYSPIAEILGAFPLANLSMNCSAPDTGKTLPGSKFKDYFRKHGSLGKVCYRTAERRILETFVKWGMQIMLCNDRARCCFKVLCSCLITFIYLFESDATNICTRIDSDESGENYIINGHKWYITGAIRPECKFALVVGKTSFKAALHAQQSIIIVPMDTKGVKVLRPTAVFGHLHDHAEIIFDNVVVPKSNILLGEGRGFEIAQARLGPGRIHHCMRSIGLAEMAMEAMAYRAHTRTAFGKKLAKKETVIQMMGNHRIELTKCRQLLYTCSAICDEYGFKDKRARKYVSMIKYSVPKTCLAIVDDAIQLHGAHGVSQDSSLGRIFLGLRTLRVADGPDVVHLNVVGKNELGRDPHSLTIGRIVSGENKNIEKYGKFKHLESKL